MDAFRRRLNNTHDVKFDFFQPLENLRGQSLANFFIRIPDAISKEIEALEENEGEMAKSLIEEVFGGALGTMSTLEKNNWIRGPGEPCYDLHFNNLLNHAFEDDKIVTSLKLIMEHILSLNTSNSLQRMVSSCLPELLDNDDDFDCFKDYFIALEPDA